MSEKTFQNLLIRYLKPDYFITFNDMYNNPGYPDLLIAKGNKFIFAELKEIESEKVLLNRTFTPFQIPWYLKYLKTGAHNIWIIARVKNQTYRYCMLNVNQSIREAKRFKDLILHAKHYVCCHSLAQIKIYIDGVFKCLKD